MKNPFLQDRNIFSKVPKPISKISKDDKEADQLADKKLSNEPKYSIKPQQKLPNPISNNQYLTTYQKQPSSYTNNYPSSQLNHPTTTTNNNNNNNNNKYRSSQKITFGDPMSSQAYTGDRTSGYFNMLNSQQQQLTSTAKPSYQTMKYDNLKYQPRKNNFFESENNNKAKQMVQTDINFRQTRKQFRKGYGGNNFNHNKADDKRQEYEFAPPPINNFTTAQSIQQKYQFQPNNYEYKQSLGNNYQQPSYQPFTKNDSNNSPSKPIQNSYKSPPKYTNDNHFPTKHDISQRFKQNNYGQFSPIGQVSRHKINQDSIMNLDGLMDGIELDKLLAESKTQQELLKILGMDASMIIRKNVDEPNQYDQNNFSKKSHQPQAIHNQFNSNNKLEALKYENDEPQVFNYSQNSSRNVVQQSKYNQKQKQNSIIQRQSPQKFTKSSTNTFINQPETNFYNENQTPYQKFNKQTNLSTNQEEEYDLEKIMQKKMENFMIQQEVSGRDKRIFMTANQKIVTKKYKLQPL